MNPKINFNSTIEIHGETKQVIWYKNESLEHWLLKSIMVYYLLFAGFKTNEIEIERQFDNQRADVYAQNQNCKIWIECNDYDNKRHNRIRKFYDGKLINVLEVQRFKRSWDYIIERKKFEDRVNRRIIQHRMVPRNCDVWAIHLGMPPKLVYGISRNHKDEFTFIKNWTISDLGPRKADKIIDLNERIKENKNPEIFQKKIQLIFK